MKDKLQDVITALEDYSRNWRKEVIVTDGPVRVAIDLLKGLSETSYFEDLIRQQSITSGWKLEMVEYTLDPLSKYHGKWTVRLHYGFSDYVAGVSHDIPSAFKAANDGAAETDAFANR